MLALYISQLMDFLRIIKIYSVTNSQFTVTDILNFENRENLEIKKGFSNSRIEYKIGTIKH